MKVDSWKEAKKQLLANLINYGIEILFSVLVFSVQTWLYILNTTVVSKLSRTFSIFLTIFYMRAGFDLVIK